MITNPFSKQEIKIIKDRLKRLRVSTYPNLSYREFSKKLGISYSRISDLEAGAMPSINDLYCYQKLFDVSFDFLLGKISSQKSSDYEISKKLGLSEKSIENLSQLQEIQEVSRNLNSVDQNRYPLFNTTIKAINSILENIDLLGLLGNYINCDFKKNEYTINQIQESITYLIEERIIDVDFSQKDFPNIDITEIILDITLKQIVNILNEIRKTTQN